MRCDLPPVPFAYCPPPDGPTLLHADAELIAVDKPSGLLSVPGRGAEHQDSALLRLQAQWGPLWVVHRLDMDTSGVIVYARTREAAAALGRSFERRQAGKVYRAWVWGRPDPAEGLIDLPLRLDWPHRPRQIVDAAAGKPSATRYRVLGAAPGPAADPPCSLLELEPLTGRSHQLRVHLAAIGCPIVGDRFYGTAQDTATRLMLHAQRLTLPHPRDGQPWAVESPAPF